MVSLARRHKNAVQLLPLLGLLLLAAITPTSVGASQLIAKNAKKVRLAVSPRGVAHLSYRAYGKKRHVLAWGAINALSPTTIRPQVKLRVDHSGGAARGGMPHWRTLRNACRPYDGPRLKWLVAACKAPDGSYWAVQTWSRIVPRGRTMTTRGVDRELRISHWRGAIAKLDMNVDWAYGRFDHVYGGLTYAGSAVYGFRTTRTGGPLDTYGRNVYLDTLHSALGRGWRRENGFVTHNPSGAFCYTLYPQAGVPFGKGEAYRATVIGPGVTPDVAWEGRAPGAFDPVRDLQANAEQQQLFRNDGRCRPR
jgi:hypothetical protein